MILKSIVAITKMEDLEIRNIPSALFIIVLCGKCSSEVLMILIRNHIDHLMDILELHKDKIYWIKRITQNLIINLFDFVHEKVKKRTGKKVNFGFFIGQKLEFLFIMTNL